MHVIAAHARQSLGTERYRFLQLGTGVLGASLASIQYAFGLVAHHMKDEFGLSQENMTLITTISSIMAFFAIPAGAAFDAFGPRVVAILGTCMGATGFFLYGLLFAQVIEFRMWLIIFASVLTSWPVGFFDLGTVVPNLYNFPLDRGSVVSIAKTFNGLGSAFLSVLYIAFAKDSIETYAYIVACVILLFGLTAATFAELPQYELQKPKTGEKGEEHFVPQARDDVDRHLLHHRASPKRFLLAKTILWVALFFFIGTSLLNAETTIVHGAVGVIFGLLALLIIGSYLLLGLLGPMEGDPASTPSQQQQEMKETTTSEEDSATAGSLSTALVVDGDKVTQEDAAAITTVFHRQNELSFFSNLLTIDIWLLWVWGLAVWGSCIIVIVNAPQIYRASNDNHYDGKINSLYIAVIGVGNALGRIASGIAEGFLQKQNKSITTLFVVPPLCAIVSLTLFLILPGGAVVLPFLVLAFGFGVSWGVMILAVRLMFLRDVGKVYNFFFTGAIVSISAFNRPLFGHFYDETGREQGLYPNCSGTLCFRTAFLIFLSLNVVAVVASWIAHRRWVVNYYSKKEGEEQFLPKDEKGIVETEEADSR